MQLREWQNCFQQCVVEPQKPHDDLFANLVPGSTSKQAQIAVYSNAYVIRLVEALRSNYPALHQLLGDKDFDAMGSAYLRQHPSSHSSIRWFGQELASFLQSEPPYAELPIMSELACFEWALRHTVDAADALRVTVQSLQAIAPEYWGDLRFALHPSASVMALQWNTPALWQALSKEQRPPEPARHATAWIIYRQADMVTAWRSVSELEMAALDCLAEEGTFSDVCEAVAQLVPDAGEGASRSAQLLRSWVEQGLVSIQTSMAIKNPP